MRFLRIFLPFFLLGTPVLGDEVLLREVRAWRGEWTVVGRGDPGPAGRGSDVQTERVTFLAITDPRVTVGARERLKIRLRRSEGTWKLALDLKERKGAGELATTGGGSGELHFLLNGVLDVKRRRVHLRTGARPHRLVARMTLSGVDAKGLAALRTVASRTPYTAGLDEWGALSEDGRTAHGERTFVDRRGRYPRTVTVRWKMVRLDPEVKGRVLDQHGRPVVGATVLARSVAGGGLQLRRATTDDEGRFRIEAQFGSWGVQVIGHEKGGIVTGGWVKADVARVRFDAAPEVEVRVKRYRLAWLPRSHLLAEHFRGDVDRFLTYLKRREPALRMTYAEVRNATN